MKSNNKILLVLSSLLIGIQGCNGSQPNSTTGLFNANPSSANSSTSSSNTPKRILTDSTPGSSTDSSQSSYSGSYPTATAYSPSIPYPASSTYFNPTNSSTSSSVPTNATQPSGQTGATSDIKERATFNGKVYDRNNIPVEGAKVTAKSVDPGVTWTGEAQVTIGGAYVFRNAPVGAIIEITVTYNDGSTRSRTEVLKSNLTGDPNANMINFDGIYAVQDEPEIISIKVNNKQGYAPGSSVKPTQSTLSSAVPNLSGLDNSNLEVSLTFSEPVDKFSVENALRIVTPDSVIDSTFSGSLFIWSPDGKSVTFKTNKPVGINKDGSEINYMIEFSNAFKDNTGKEAIPGKYIRFNSVTQGDYLIFSGKVADPNAFSVASQTDNFFVDYGVNPFVDTLRDHLSTFSIDVDTASYTWMRKSVMDENTLPDRKSVRIEEYVNFFNYHYPLPAKDSFTINTDIVQAPFSENNKKIIRIGLQGKELGDEKRKDVVLTFVIDISGSMEMESRLGLVKQSLELLIKQLKTTDKVNVVVFGTTARVLLENKSAGDEGQILNTIRALRTEGSTNTEDGLTQGFGLAQRYYKSGAVNRVILCSDGVANTGITNPEAISNKIKQLSEGGIFLSTVGFGMGNYNDTLMEQLANKGDGYYAYVDNLKEAYRVFVENLNGTLQTIAKDVKIQVDFNPSVVKQYRLLGYENRDIKDQDFRNDSTDAGEVGINTSVTALYEVDIKENSGSGKVADVFLRYKDSNDSNKVKEFNKPIMTNEINNNFSSSSSSFKLAASVAMFAEILRHSYWARDGRFSDVLKTAREAQNSYKYDQNVSEFISIVEKASKLPLK